MANWEASGRKILKVPLFLRDKSDAYDPKAVSLGPYHHGKPELQFCQNAKHLTLRMFVEGSGHTHEFFKEEVGKVVAYARSCYVEGSTDGYTDEQFAEMMLHDACFLIYWMGVHDGSISPRHFFLYVMGTLVRSMIAWDIFLVENQIPFRVVMHLINLRYDKKKGEEAVTKFIYESIWVGYWTPEQAEVSENILQDQNRHFEGESPLHILEAFHSVFAGDFTLGCLINMKGDPDIRSPYKSFRSAMDLKAKGIHFKPSKERSLNSIHFQPFTLYCQLELPVCFVSHISEVFFLNMIAYELCTGAAEAMVTSYVAFMKSLIQKPADVKVLRERGILVNTLGSDEEVVQFYRKLETFGMGDIFEYMEAMRLIQEHCHSKAKTWIEELINTHLSSPWSVIALFAALLILIFTFLQTYFTIAK